MASFLTLVFAVALLAALAFLPEFLDRGRSFCPGVRWFHELRNFFLN